MDILWLAAIMLSFSWSYLLHIYAKPNILIGVLFIVFSFAIAVFAFRKAVQNKRSVVHCCMEAFKYCFFILFSQVILLPFFYIWASRNHAQKILTSIVCAFLNLFRMKCVWENAILYLQTPLKRISFLSTWEKFGSFYLFLFLIAIAVTLLLKKEKKISYLKFFAITLFYFILRYVFLIILYGTYFMHSIFWERVLTFVTLIPLMIIFMRIKTSSLEYIDIKRGQKFDLDKKICAALSFLLAISYVFFLNNPAIGILKKGRVLIDEFHSDWEWTTQAYDENWFGERSGYNYYCLYEYIDKFYQTRRNHDVINAEALKDCDVLILKTPTKAYTDEEVNDILEFVRKGGGLYLIGDHTNVFGTGTHLNKLAKHFDLRFRYDCTYELEEGNLSQYQKPLLFSHPVVQELPLFLFATSNTLQAPWYAQDIIVGYGLKNLQADYSQKNFFPENQNDPNLEFGLFLQSAAVSYGKGRVLAFTDSTVFSNFWMFMNGKPQLLLSSLHWLNHENLFEKCDPKQFFGALLIVSIFLNIWWWAKERLSFSPAVFLSFALIGGFLSIATVSMINRRIYQLPEPIKPIVRIGFDREYSDYMLPDTIEGFKSQTQFHLTTFYVWTQRLQYVPKTYENLLNSLKSSNLTVIAKPTGLKQVDEILKQVEDGAFILILDDIKSGAFSNALLEKADMKLVDAQMSQFAHFEEITQIPLTENACSVKGGEILMADKNNHAVFSIKRVGKGVIAVFSDPDLFYNHHLGDVSMNLTPKTQVLSKLEFKMMKFLISEQTKNGGKENE